MKNFSKIVDNFDVTTKKYVDDGLAEKANSSELATVAADVSGKLSKTENTGVNVLGTTKSTTTLGGNQLVAPNGIIFAGTAANAGLVTRGICGVTTPDSKGACSKDNLYINYDGANTYNTGRMLILQAGETGTNYGNNMYQYAVPRGDIVKAWVEAKGYTTNKGTVTQVKINGTTKSPDSAGLVDLGTVGGSSDNSKFDYTVLTNEDLNTVIEAGRYRGEQGNTCAHNPIFGRPMPAFFLTVETNGSGVVRQTAYVAEGIANTYFQWYVRVSDNNGSSWAKWIEQQSMTGDYSQSFASRKFFDNGIGISSSLQFSNDAGSNGQFAMSQGSSLTPKWVNLQVRVNGTTYTADSSGLIDLGEISGGGSTSSSQFNDIY